MPGTAVDICKELLHDKDREHFAVLMLNAKCQAIGVSIVHIGSLTCTMVCARDVFKVAILANASMIIVAHNHPSGDPKPSPEDHAVTKVLVTVGNLLDIPVIDHVIVGEHAMFSFKGRGVMPEGNKI
jgi:DNA repair protein RadC